jgi:glutamine synthetase
MLCEPLTMFCYTDLAGQVRGKGFPSRQLEKRLANGIGWTPNNLMFTALGTIAPGGWSSFGDLTLMPDPDTRVEVDFEDGSPAERFFLCDLLNTDGAPWDCCPRTLLRDAAAELERETGLVLRATFEQEFVYSGANPRLSDMYALDAVRRHGAFGETYLGALKAAGVEVDGYLPEFAPGQFEVTAPPVEAVAACDNAMIIRELARATAWRLGHSVTFSPRTTPDGLGSGVHIHFSLWDRDGRPVSHDPAAPHGVSAVAGQFLAGVLRHMPALCAFTAPSPVSYLRLVAHAWTGVWSNLGLRDREAGVRICPTFGAAPDAVARQFNFEYRAADATASPYLQLATILRTGLCGIRGGLATPTPTIEQDPETMSPDERVALGIVRLPASVDAAFAALDADSVVQGLLPERLLRAYMDAKRAEFALSAGWTPEEICTRYAEVY